MSSITILRDKNTQRQQGNMIDLVIPKVRMESGKKGIYYSGTKIYNALPLALKTEKYYVHFKSALKEHFMD